MRRKDKYPFVVRDKNDAFIYKPCKKMKKTLRISKVGDRK
jgi:hypothetical protein